MSPDGFSGSSIQHGTHHFIKSLIGVTFQCALSIFINQATPKTWNETPSRSESIVIQDYGKTWIYGISKTPHVSKTKRKTKSWTTVDKSGTGTNPDNTKKGSQSPANYVCKHWFPLPLSSVWSTRSCGEEGDTRPRNTRVSRVLEISLGILFFYRHSEWGPEN